MRGYHTTEPFAEAPHKRTVWVASLVAGEKVWHGLRSLERVHAEALLIAAGQDLKRLPRRWGGGRRPWSNATAGLGPPALAPGLVAIG